MYFRWTLFNGITLFVMALTAAMIYIRFRFPPEKTWPLFYYLAPIGYARAFGGSLNKYWVFAGLVFGLILRFEFLGGPVPKVVRAAEIAVLAYVIVRGFQLLLLWPW